MKVFNDLTPAERKVFERLNTPQKIQDYLDKLPMNFSDVDPCLCPRDVIKKQKAHCMEGALFAAAALWYHGKPPLLLDLTVASSDNDHVVTLFKDHGYFGAISKTNHGVLRYREPVYKSVRELAMSFFHEYFLNNGKKTLRTYSAPFDLSKYKDTSWITSRKGIMDLIESLNDSNHYQILNKHQLKNLRKASLVEIEAGKVVEWKRGNKVK